MKVSIFKSFSNFFKKKSKKNYQRTVELNQLLDFLGLKDTKEDALSEATYFTCLKILSETMGKLPFKIMKETEEGGVTKFLGPMYRVIRYKPNPYMTATTFWSVVEFNRNHYGNAYVYIKDADTDTPTLWILPPGSVQIWYDNAKKLSDVSTLWYIYSCPEDGNIYKLTSEQVLHFKTSVSFDGGVTGIPVAAILESTVNGTAKAQNLLNRMYETGFVAKAVLQYTGDLNDDNVKRLVRGTEQYAMGAVSDAKSMIPIPLGYTLTPLNTKFTDAQFLELKRYSALQIAAAFGIKPNQINDYEKASYAAAEQQNLAFYVDTMLYIIKQYEEEVTYKLLTDKQISEGIYTKFNVSVMLRADLKTQLESLTKAVAGSIYTPDEARAFLDMHAMGCDELLCNGTMIPVKEAGKQYERNGEIPHE